MVVFYKISVIADQGNSDTETEKKGTAKKAFLLRYYTVFNIEQTTLDAEKYSVSYGTEEVKTADDILTGYDCPISYYGSRACYSPTHDKITMPAKSSFKTTEGFYSTLFHEVSHSTGHEKRLGRDLIGSFGSPSYAKEELIAEISSAMIMQSIGMSKSIDNTAAYCQSWIKVLKNDKNMIVAASSKAEKAYNFILKKEVPVYA
jgi:antirestriction protein ArdC